MASGVGGNRLLLGWGVGGMESLREISLKKDDLPLQSWMFSKGCFIMVDFIRENSPVRVYRNNGSSTGGLHR